MKADPMVATSVQWKQPVHWDPRHGSFGRMSSRVINFNKIFFVIYIKKNSQVQIFFFIRWLRKGGDDAHDSFYSDNIRLHGSWNGTIIGLTRDNSDRRLKEDWMGDEWDSSRATRHPRHQKEDNYKWWCVQGRMLVSVHHTWVSRISPMIWLARCKAWKK